MSHAADSLKLAANDTQDSDCIRQRTTPKKVFTFKTPVTCGMTGTHQMIRLPYKNKDEEKCYL